MGNTGLGISVQTVNCSNLTYCTWTRWRGLFRCPDSFLTKRHYYSRDSNWTPDALQSRTPDALHHDIWCTAYITGSSVRWQFSDAVSAAEVWFELFTVVKIWIGVFRAVTPCSSVGGYQRFGGTCRFHPQGRSKSRRRLPWRWRHYKREDHNLHVYRREILTSHICETRSFSLEWWTLSVCCFLGF
jgi:hypothetical protein